MTREEPPPLSVVRGELLIVADELPNVFIAEQDLLECLRYPVGRMPRHPDPLDTATRTGHLSILERAPARFRALADGLTEIDLERQYRPGGWTVRQVFHHV